MKRKDPHAAPAAGDPHAAPIDLVLLEVVRNKLVSIAEEMQFTLLQCAFSPLVKEGMDCSAALFTAAGETLAQATAIPVHLGTMTPALASLMRVFPVETMAPGDAYILSDPYLGGSHLPDITIALPVFVDGRVLAICVTTVHHQDVGGMSIGSLPSNATEVYQEGLRIPPLKLLDRGEMNTTLQQILIQNSRTPDALLGDIHAQLSANSVAHQRLQELAANYPTATLLRLFDELLDRSEHMTRLALSQLPQGTFVAEDWLDNDGIDLDQKIRIRVAVTISGDRIHYDFTGCSPQVKGPINCVPAGAHAAANYATRVLTGADIPSNGGCFRPIRLTLPEGSIVNPREPAAVNSRLNTIKRLCSVIVCAFSEALPERIPAAPGNVLTALTFGGQREDGSRFMLSELIASGAGASHDADGVDCIQTDGSNSMNQPVEALMLDTPIRVLRFALRKECGGAGQFRGGTGVVREYRCLVDNVYCNYRGERHTTRARGTQGGGDGLPSRATVYRRDGSVQVLPSRTSLVLHAQDRLVIETAGGGGYGPPGRRRPENRQADARRGLTYPSDT